MACSGDGWMSCALSCALLPSKTSVVIP